MNRVLTVMRIQILTSRSTLVWPWAILAMAFGVNLAIFGILGNSVPDPTTGGLASIYVFMIVLGGMLVTQMFSFALGMSVTRRTFYIATALVTVAMSIAFGIALYLLSLIERGTGGWGMRLRFFGLAFMGSHNPLTQILMYVAPFLVVTFAGMFCGVVFTRWGTNGVFTLTLITILVSGGAAVLLTWQHAWTPTLHWFGDQGVVALLAGWPILPAAALALAGYLAIRRATP
jgi:hypothetical protein